MEELFRAFESSLDTLRVYEGERLVFSSRKDRLSPILEFLALEQRPAGVDVFDRIAGNAAALLAIKAGARSLWSPLGSRAAARTLAGFGVATHFTALAEAILRPGSQEVCPMEKLSLGLDPEAFYALLTGGGAASDAIHGC